MTGRACGASPVAKTNSRMFRGFLSTWAGLIVNGIVTFLLTRVLVHGLGNFYYGLWILVSSVLDYYGLLDMGVRYSMQRFVARYGGANERNALNETFMTGVSMAACIATAAVILCAILLIVLPGFFGLIGESRNLFRVLLTIQTVTLALDFPARIMGAYLCGLHRFDLYNGAGIVWGISRGIVFWAVIHLGGKVTGIAISQLIIVACMFVLVLVLRQACRSATQPGMEAHQLGPDQGIDSLQRLRVRQ